MNTVLPFPTDEHKEQPVPERNAFKLRIAAERKAEAEALAKREEEEAVERGEKKSAPKPKKVKKEKKPRKTRAKKVKKEPISLKIIPVVKKQIKLPVYQGKVEVNEFNKFKVDYIRKQIHHCKDKERKAIYENALTKYDMTNYHNLK